MMRKNNCFVQVELIVEGRLIENIFYLTSKPQNVL